MIHRFSQHFLSTAIALIITGAFGCVHYRPQPISTAESAKTLEGRKLDDAGLKAFIATNAPELAKEWPRPAWDLTGLTLVGLYYHPGLDVARAQWQASRASIITASARPNPSVSVTPEYTANPASGLTPWIATIQFDVPIETAGKRHHRIVRAEQLAKAVFLQLASSGWKVRSDVRAGLVDWTVARLSSESLQRQYVLQSNVVAALEQRLAAGAVANSDVGLARIALSKTLVSAGEAKARSSAARVHLSQVLGLPLIALEGVEIQFDISAPPVDAERFTTAAIRQQSLQGRADVLSALAEYAATEASLRLEIARQYPDVHLSPGYQYNQGENKWGLGLAVELPVLNQNQGPIAEANARRAEAAARFTSLQAGIINKLDAAGSAYHEAQEQLGVTEALVSSEAAGYRTVEQQVKAGDADPLDLLYAELERLLGENARLDARSRLQNAIGQLEDAVQQPLDAPEMRTIDLSRNPRANP